MLCLGFFQETAHPAFLLLRLLLVSSIVFWIVLLAHVWTNRRRAHRVRVTERGINISAGVSQKEVAWGQILEVSQPRSLGALVVDTELGVFEIGDDLPGFELLKNRFEQNSEYFLKRNSVTRPDSPLQVSAVELQPEDEPSIIGLYKRQEP